MTTAQKILKIANENPLQKSDYTLKMYVGLKTLDLMQVTLPFSRVIGQKHTVSLDNNYQQALYEIWDLTNPTIPSYDSCS